MLHPGGIDRNTIALPYLLRRYPCAWTPQPGILQPSPIGQPLPLAPRPGVAGGIPPSFSSSPPPPQPSASQPLPWLWPPLLSWLLLLVAVKGGTAAPPHAVVASYGAVPRASRRHLVKCQKGRGKT